MSNLEERGEVSNPFCGPLHIEAYLQNRPPRTGD